MLTYLLPAPDDESCSIISVGTLGAHRISEWEDGNGLEIMVPSLDMRLSLSSSPLASADKNRLEMQLIDLHCYQDIAAKNFGAEYRKTAEYVREAADLQHWMGSQSANGFGPGFPTWRLLFNAGSMLRHGKGIRQLYIERRKDAKNRTIAYAELAKLFKQGGAMLTQAPVEGSDTPQVMDLRDKNANACMDIFHTFRNTVIATGNRIRAYDRIVNTLYPS